MSSGPHVPNRWREGPPDTRSEGTMYQFVRDHLRSKGGRCHRAELLAAMEAEPMIAKRLSQSRGFNALLTNMRHSREITFEGDEVIATLRALRRRQSPQSRFLLFAPCQMGLSKDSSRPKSK